MGRKRTNKKENKMKRTRKKNAENSPKKRVRVKEVSTPRKRKRVKNIKQKTADNKLFICDRVKEGAACWYVGACPHRKPHKHTVKNGIDMCEEGFCSLMKLTTGCIPYKKEK